ncbi:hypothetical protein NHJ6243_010119 [Beauveria neobassiana]
MKLDTRLPREQDIANSLVQGFDRKHFQRLLLKWIVEENHSFRVCEQGRLRRIFEYLNPLVKITDANISRTIIRRQVLASYEAHKDKVAAVLQRSPGLIHVSFDGWKSGNRHSLYGVTYFFRDENSKPCKLVLGVPELRLRHHGYNIAAEILDVLAAYGIQDKIRYFTLDNADSNDKAMEIVLEHLAKLLGFYEDAVRTLEGDGQLQVLEKYKQLACGIPNSEHLRININLGWEKLNKYYSLLDKTPIYYTALALHPAFRWGYFENEWKDHPDWVVKAKQAVREV